MLFYLAGFPAEGCGGAASVSSGKGRTVFREGPFPPGGALNTGNPGIRAIHLQIYIKSVEIRAGISGTASGYYIFEIE